MAELTWGAFLPPPPPIQYRVRPDPVQNRVKQELILCALNKDLYGFWAKNDYLLYLTYYRELVCASKPNRSDQDRTITYPPLYTTAHPCAYPRIHHHPYRRELIFKLICKQNRIKTHLSPKQRDT